MPGVPPNALPKLKSFLKGMIGGKKKNPQSQSQQQQPAQNPNQKPPQQEQQQRADSQQHPPAQTDASAAAAAAPAAGQPVSTSKQDLPTTDAHVSSNAPASSSQGALAGSGEAGSAAAPDPNVAGGPQGAQEVQDRKIEQLSERTDGQGSTLAVDAKDMDPAKSSMAGTTSTKSLNEDAATPTEEVESADTAAQPNGAPVSGTEASEKEKEKGVENQPPPTITLNNAATISDEKMPVMAEPPAVKPVKTAPGMSATSGPLEDFP